MVQEQDTYQQNTQPEKARRLSTRFAWKEPRSPAAREQDTLNPIKDQSSSRWRSGSRVASVGLRGARRQHAERLVQRARWLQPADRALIEAVYAEGLSVAAYVRRCRARQTEPVPSAGVDFGDDAIGLEMRSRLARRRLRRLVERLLSDRFVFVTARWEDWTTTRRRVAAACVVQGRSMRAASRDLGLSLHTVRRHMQAIEALVAEACRSDDGWRMP
jgi:hypothetical protein